MIPKIIHLCWLSGDAYPVFNVFDISQYDDQQMIDFAKTIVPRMNRSRVRMSVFTTILR